MLPSRARRFRIKPLIHFSHLTGEWSSNDNELLLRLVQQALAPERIPIHTLKVKDSREVNKDIIDWNDISSQIGGRPKKQCFEHWYYVLAPAYGAVPMETEEQEWGIKDDHLMLQR